jgi:peptidoglycan hydrolase-like protein with peptidoglycan-binding domain
MVDNGWSRVGYHFFINKNGNIQQGCPIEQIPIAQKGHNTGSIAICLHGLKKSKFTTQQLESVKKLCGAITDSYDKKIRIRGHKEVSTKACPVFDYRATLGLGTDGYYTKTASTTGAMQIAEPQTNTINIGRKAKSIRLTDKGSHVKALQSLLTKLGYACAVDGDFGQNTVSKIMAFQRKSGLKADGIIGTKSIEKMFSGKNIVLKRMHKGQDVGVLQLLLAMLGKNMMHDGIFGLGTEKALMSLQKLFGLKADGIFGDISRKKMLN